jgi:polyisoprenoid-binding protein YceI
MTRFLRFSILCAFLLTPFAATAETFRIDKGHSSVEFSIRHMVSKVTGQFDDFSGKIVYDAEAPEKSTVEATIVTTSVNTAHERRDNHLRNEDFFEVEKYPEITFKSKSTKAEGDMLMVTGDLTMHGTTREVVLSVEVIGVGKHPRRGTPMAGFEAQLKVSRADFGVNHYTDVAKILGDAVTISLNIRAAAGGGRGQGQRRRGQGQQGGGEKAK